METSSFALGRCVWCRSSNETLHIVPEYKHRNVQSWVAKAFHKATASWPLRHLEITLPTIGVVTLLGVLILRRLR